MRKIYTFTLCLKTKYLIFNCLKCVIFTHYKQSICHIPIVGFRLAADGTRLVLFFDDV